MSRIHDAVRLSAYTIVRLALGLALGVVFLWSLF